MTEKKPSLDVLLERLKQNTIMTSDIKKQVTEGFKGLNGRLTAAEKRLDKIEWQKQFEKEELEKAREDAKDEILKTAQQVKTDVSDKPNIGSTKWVLVTFVTIILALIAAMHH